MTTRALFLVLSGMALLQTACSDSEREETSNQGTLEITTDWSDYSAEAELPGNYTLCISTIGEQQMDNRKASFQSVLPIGMYELIAYNTPGNMTVNNYTAIVGTDEDGRLLQPGYLFSNTRAKSVLVEADRTMKATLKMKQQVRRLTLTLVPQGGEASQIEGNIEATLTGIASSLAINTGDLSAPGTMKLTFTRQPSTGNYSATLRILGGAGNEQKLTLSLLLSGGRNYSIESDLTEELKYFGNDISPLVLKATLELPEGAGSTGSIQPWEPEFGEGGENVDIQ